MASASRWLWPAATGIAGLAAGLLLAPGPSVVPANAFAPTAERAPGANLTAEDVRRVVREELAARGTATGAGTRPEATLPPIPETIAPETAAKQFAAAAQAQSVLDGALARRNWTEQDADGMREVFNTMSPDQQGEFLRQFAMAVNQGRLVPQTERVPF